jgi:predicted nucleic acid-binding protein
MIVFADTSAFFALLDRDDANHQKTKKMWSNTFNSENTLITTNYIIVECFALIQHRLGLEAVKAK